MKQKRLPSILIALLLLLTLNSCDLFDSNSKTPTPCGGNCPIFQIQNTVTGELEEISIPIKETDKNSYIQRELYLPVYISANPSFLGKKSELKTLGDNYIEEEGRKVRYIIRTQSFGYWNKTLEQIWVHFQLQTQHTQLAKNWLALDTTQSLEEMVATLNDPYSSYIDSNFAQAFYQAVTTTKIPGAIGIRMELNSTFDSLIIKMVSPNSPAEEAGMQKNDIILRVNDTSVVGDSAILVFNQLTEGDSGTTLTFTLLKQNGKQETITLIKRPVDFPSVLADTLQNLGYIRVFSFTGTTLPGQSTSSEFADALTATAGFPLTILDFRQNGGGSVEETTSMLDEVADGVLFKFQQRVHFENRSWIYKEDVKGSSGGVGLNREYLLLADSGTASASEIFIASIKEKGNVTQYGETTFGKGVGQLIPPTPAKGVLRVTVAEYLSPGGHSYNKTGLLPDISTSSAEALKRALEDQKSLAKKGFSLRLKKQLELLEFDARERVRSFAPVPNFVPSNNLLKRFPE